MCNPKCSLLLRCMGPVVPASSTVCCKLDYLPTCMSCGVGFMTILLMRLIVTYLNVHGFVDYSLIGSA